MIRASAAHRVGLPVKHASQCAHRVDGITPLDVDGECHISVSRGGRQLTLSALVVEKLDVYILAGTPFMVYNDIAIRPAMKEIVIKGDQIVVYGEQQISKTPSISRIQAYYVLRGPNRKTVILPGEFELPKETEPDTIWALEPRFDNKLASGDNWPPLQEVRSIDHVVRLTNSTEVPVVVRKHEHICQVRYITSISDNVTHSKTVHTVKQGQSDTPFSKDVSIDPDNGLSPELRDKFTQLHAKHDKVFNPTLSKYNAASGRIEGNVNMGPVLPPQRKGRMHQYNQDKLKELQDKFDELEKSGVFAKPEQVNVSIEYLNL